MDKVRTPDERQQFLIEVNRHQRTLEPTIKKWLQNSSVGNVWHAINYAEAFAIYSVCIAQGYGAMLSICGNANDVIITHLK